MLLFKKSGTKYAYYSLFDAYIHIICKTYNKFTAQMPLIFFFFSVYTLIIAPINSLKDKNCEQIVYICI